MWATAYCKLRHLDYVISLTAMTFIARLGGDEFTIILSDTTTEDATAVAKSDWWNVTGFMRWLIVSSLFRLALA